MPRPSTFNTKYVPSLMEKAKGKLFILSAPSGSGKTTLSNLLLKRYPQLSFSISATTRQPRDYEQEGLHYYFLSKERFQQCIAAEGFVEWEEVYAGTYYGTLKSEIDRIYAEGKCPILDIDVEGGVNLKQQYGEQAVAVFVQPPSLEALRERLVQRGTETEASLAKRLAKAEQELGYAQHFDHVIINDDLEAACDNLCALFAEYLDLKLEQE